MTATVTSNKVKRVIDADVELALTDEPVIDGRDPGNKSKKRLPIAPEDATVHYVSRDDGKTWFVNVLVYGDMGERWIRGFAQYQGNLRPELMPEWLFDIVAAHVPTRETTDA